MNRRVAILLASLALAGCATASTADNEVLGSAELRQANGLPAGTASLVAVGSSLALDVAVSGVPAGTRGFHLHTTGQCTPPDFQSAGGHLNPSGNQHGSANPAGPHLGDLPNIRIEPHGITRTRFPLDGERDELLSRIFDVDGTSVMIHAQQDDYVTDPTGNAGGRIVCGVMRPAG